VSSARKRKHIANIFYNQRKFYQERRRCKFPELQEKNSKSADFWFSGNWVNAEGVDLAERRPTLSTECNVVEIIAAGSKDGSELWAAMPEMR